MTIKQSLKKLSEDGLRQKVLIPLLSLLGCKDVRDNCGSTEYGKDILYLNRDHFLKEKIWGAAVVKKSDISKGTILDNVERQINDAITQFIDPDDPRNKIRIHEILLITSGKITSQAQKYIYENSGKSFQNIHFITGDRLEYLIHQVIIEYNKKNNTNYIFNITTFGTLCDPSSSHGNSNIPEEGKPIE